MTTRTKPDAALASASAARGYSIRPLLDEKAVEVRRLVAAGEPIMCALEAVSKRAGIGLGSRAFDALAARCGLHYNRQLDLYLTRAEELAWGH
jgi:hypothetical protein